MNKPQTCGVCRFCRTKVRSVEKECSKGLFIISNIHKAPPTDCPFNKKDKPAKKKAVVVPATAPVVDEEKEAKTESKKKKKDKS